MIDLIKIRQNRGEYNVQPKKCAIKKKCVCFFSIACFYFLLTWTSFIINFPTAFTAPHWTSTSRTSPPTTWVSVNRRVMAAETAWRDATPERKTQQPRTTYQMQLITTRMYLHRYSLIYNETSQDGQCKTVCLIEEAVLKMSFKDLIKVNLTCLHWKSCVWCLTLTLLMMMIYTYEWRACSKRFPSRKDC